MVLLSLASLVVSVLPSAPLPGGVHLVGPTRAHTTIQSAVDVATHGDVVLVDPGAYPEFAIDGKGISVVAAAGSFAVLESPSAAPAILIENVPFGVSVSIVGAQIDHGISADTPAVHARNNFGAVRLGHLEVNPRQDLFGSLASAVVVFESTSTFWLIDSRVWSNTPYIASSVSGSGGWYESVSAVEVQDSRGILQNVKLIGYDAALAYAGDALRVRGDSRVRLLDDFVDSADSTILRGGNGVYGGSAVQRFGAKRELNRVQVCGSFKYQPGNGSTQPGGVYAVNGDGGIISGSFGGQRAPKGCSSLEYGETSVASPTTSLGGRVDVRLWTVLPSNVFTFAGINTVYRPVLGRLSFAMLDVFAPIVTVHHAQIAGSTRYDFSFVVANDPALVGLQVTLQSLFGPLTGPLAGTLYALTFPAPVVLVP